MDKSNIFLAQLSMVMLSMVSFSALSATDTMDSASVTGSTVNSSVDSISYTITSPSNWHGGSTFNYGTDSPSGNLNGNLVFTANDTSTYTFTFNSALDITSIAVLELQKRTGSSYIFTDTTPSSSNSSVSVTSASFDSSSSSTIGPGFYSKTVNLNWSGVTSFTVTTSGMHFNAQLGFDNLVASAPSADSDGALTAANGVSEPVSLATTVDSSGEAINLFDFTLTDGGSGDGLPLDVSQIVVNVAGTASDAQRAKISYRLSGPDATNVTGVYNASADTLTFSGLSISVADGASEVYTLNAYYHDNTGITEGNTLLLSLDGDTDVTVSGSNTQFGATTAVNNGSGTTLEVTATALAFTTQPAGSVSGSALTTQPIVRAQDAFGNTDVDFTETVTLTEASDGTLSGDSVAAVNGVATFTALTYSATADQQSFTVTANDQDGVGSDLASVAANAVIADVVATQLVFETQPAPLSVKTAEATSLTTVPVISARDALNVVDSDYVTGITLSEVNGAGSAIMTVTGDTDASNATVTVTPDNGVATFTALQLTYTASGGSSESFNIRASSGGLTSVDSSPLTAIVADNDASLTAASGVSEPVGLPTTADTTGEAVDLFDFTLTDGGTADGFPLEVSQIVVNVAGTASDAQRAKISYRLSGPDATNVTGVYNASADTLTFSGLSISVADGASEVYTLNAYYHDNTGITEGNTLLLSLDGDTDVTVSGSNTQFGATTAVNNGSGTTLEVTATALAFTTQPAGSVSGSALTTQPIVRAQDAFGNTDVDFTETVTLTEASDGTLSGDSVAAVNGVATFTALTYSATADQQSFTVTANDQDGVGSDLASVAANAVIADVVATQLVFETQPAPLSVKTAEATSLTTVPVISARDALNVVDSDYVTGITLSEVNGAGSAIMTVTGDTDASSATVTIAPDNGVATFTALQLTYTASGLISEVFNLKATSGELTLAISEDMTGKVNTPPVFSNLDATPEFTEDGSPVVIDSDASVSDAELDALSGGAGNYDGATLTIERKGGANANDLFANHGNLGVLTEGGALTYNGTIVGTVTRNSSGTLVLTFNSNATTAMVNGVLQNITYQNEANEPASSIVLSFTFNDGEDNSTGTNEVTTTVTGRNDAPTLTVTVTNPTFIEGGEAVALYQGSDVSTVESDQSLVGFVLTVSNVSDTSEEALMVSGHSVALNHGQTGSVGEFDFVVSLVDNIATVSFNGATLTEEAFQDLVNGIRYLNGSEDPSVDIRRVVTIAAVTDSGSENATATLALASNVTLVAINDAPTLKASALNSTYTENAEAVLLFNQAAASTIENGQTFTGLVLTVSNVIDASEEVLTIDGTLLELGSNANGMTSTRNLAYSVVNTEQTSTITLSGMSLTQVQLQALVNGITYFHSSDHPSVDKPRVVTLVALTDSGESSGDNINTAALSVSSTVAVAEINDVPVITGLVPSFAAIEDEISNIDLSAIVVSDAEGDEVTLVFQVSSGRLTVAGGNGVTNGVTVSGSGTASVMLTGAAEDINLWLDGTNQIHYTSAANSNGNVVLMVTPSDTDDGSTATSVVVVGSVNDAPTISGTPTTTVEEDSAYRFTPLANDIEIDTLSFSITNKPSWASFDTVTGELSGTPKNAHVGTTAGIVISVSDGQITSSLPAFSLVVTNVNDGPVAENDRFTFPVTENGIYTLDVLQNDIDVDDGDVMALSWVSTDQGSTSISEGAITLTTTHIGLVNLRYGIVDGNGGSATGEAIVIIEPSSTKAPVVTAAADITVNATGLFTKVNLGVATAIDSQGNALPVSLIDSDSFFEPGLHTVYWRATDAEGNEGRDSQLVTVNPLITIGKDDITTEGSTHRVGVYLNGEAPSYPVSVDYTVSGSADASDHSLTNGQVVISHGTEGYIEFAVNDDSVNEGIETLVISLVDSMNLGSKSSYTLTISESNIAPEVSVSVSQNDQTRSIIENSDQVVTVTTTVTDANQGDSHSYRWINDNAQLANISNDATQFVFSPESLEAGIYRIQVEVTDSASAVVTRDVYIEVVEQLETLVSGQDSDGDLIPDVEEGLGDSDNDGIPDYQDAISECNVVQEQALESHHYLVEGEPGVCLRKGITLASNETGGLLLLNNELSDDLEARNIGGIFDFVAYGLPTPGQTYQIVFPQRLPIPASAIYRKYRDNLGWIDFVTNSENFVSSTQGEAGYCPPPGDESWSRGLTEGHWCVQLTVQDGGPNDDDGIENGTIVDPGGVATTSSNTLPNAVNDNVYVALNSSVTVDVLSNDGDADNDTLSVVSATATFGSVSIEQNQVVYRAAQGFYGTDTIRYGVSDGNGGTAYADVTVNVTPTAGSKVSNSAGGGSLGVTVVLLLGMLSMMRHCGRVFLGGFLSLICFTSQASWFVNGDVGMSLADGRSSAYDEFLQSQDSTDIMWSFGLGYQFADRWAISGRYLDLGEGSATLDHDVSLPPSEYHARVAKVTPVLAKGFALDIQYKLFHENNASVNAIVGGFAWEVDYKSEYQGETIKSSDDGIDPYVGLGLDYQFAERWSAGWQITRYFIDVNDVTTFSANLRYHFGD
ncbi:Ig-like domain-containing protein [Vibrio sp. 16]|uniref:Ig-like domain-containing protein n=1 Tax=Vibrio sp. 16 TaxID=391586 RepID=UPI0005C60813|nr:Ig-like domain-containing protein [Vibrio sp. 16]